MTHEKLKEQARIAKESFLRRAMLEPYLYPLYLDMIDAEKRLAIATAEYERAKKKWDEECS